LFVGSSSINDFRSGRAEKSAREFVTNSRHRSTWTHWLKRRILSRTETRQCCLRIFCIAAGGHRANVVEHLHVSSIERNVDPDTSSQVRRAAAHPVVLNTHRRAGLSRRLTRTFALPGDTDVARPADFQIGGIDPVAKADVTLPLQLSALWSATATPTNPRTSPDRIFIWANPGVRPLAQLGGFFLKSAVSTLGETSGPCACSRPVRIFRCGHHNPPNAAFVIPRRLAFSGRTIGSIRPVRARRVKRKMGVRFAFSRAAVRRLCSLVFCASTSSTTAAEVGETAV